MEYKIQAVKLAKEIGGAKAATELGIPENTLYARKKAISLRKQSLFSPPAVGSLQGAENDVYCLKNWGAALSKERFLSTAGC